MLGGRSDRMSYLGNTRIAKNDWGPWDVVIFPLILLKDKRLTWTIIWKKISIFQKLKEKGERKKNRSGRMNLVVEYYIIA